MYLEKAKVFLKQLKIQSFVFIYILMFITLPIVPRMTSRFLTTYFYMGIVVMTVVFSFISCRVQRIKEYVLFLAPFVIYELLELVSKHDDNVLLAGYQALLFMLPVCIGYYLITHSFLSGMYSVLLMVLFVITAFTTIVGCINNPDAARMLATTKDSQDPMAVYYEWMNIGGYGFVYSAVLLYPYLILAFKMKKLPLVFVIAYAVLLFYLAINASYTYAMLLLILSSLLFFVKRDMPLKQFILLLIGFIIIVLLFRAVIAAILSYIGNIIGNTDMVDKMNAAFVGKDAVDNFDDDRGFYYMLSINRFLQSPLFGSLKTGRTVTGGHSFILDNLALYGLVGAALMILMYRGIFQLFYKPLEEKTGYCFVFWIFLQPLLLSAINTGMWLNNLCIFTPIFMCAIYGKNVYIDAVKRIPPPQIPVTRLQSKVIQK